MPFVTNEEGELEHVPMDGEDMLLCRKQFDMKRIEFGQLLGMTGQNRNIYNTIKRYEEGRRPISPTVERLLIMLKWHHRDHGHLPDLDQGVMFR